MPSPPCSIILVTYNSEGPISGTMTAIRRVLPGTEVIVVDNGSIDATVATATRALPNATVLSGHGNPGFGAGCNLGARAATRPLLIFLNPDASPIASDLDALAALAEVAPLGLVACRVKDPHGPPYLELPDWGWRTELLWALSLALLKPRQLRMPRPRPARRSTRWIGGAAFAVRRAEFLRLGGFDERFFLYHEDRDLSRRYRKHNLPMRKSRFLTVAHEGGASSASSDESRVLQGMLGLLQLVAIWDGPSSARQAARWLLAVLTLVAVAGRALQFVPLLGRRSGVKGAAALSLRESIVSIARGTQASGGYPDALVAVRAANNGGHR